jgi:hypothetical protein
MVAASASNLPAASPPGAVEAPPAKPRPAHRKPEARSRVTNGRQEFLVPTDQRSVRARRWRDVCTQITADLGGEPMSEAQRQLVRRATTIAVQCEVMEADAANGREINLDTYGQLTDRLGRVLSRLGIKRQPRDVSPDLRSYVASMRTG